MKIKTLSKRLVIAIGLGAVLSGATVFSAISEGMAACTVSHSELSGGPAAVTARKLIADPREASGRSPMVALPAHSGEVVMEWNQKAVELTLSSTPALAPVQQTRVMAIVQVAVHDAVNGITGEYGTYLSPGPASENASPEAAAIAAAHHALKNLFSSPSQVALLDAHYADSLTAHGLSEYDPGIEYGRSAAAAILASRANDLSAQAQYPYTVPGAGTPGVWMPISSAANAQALLPGWGNVTPWVLRSGSQFRPDAPPALDSEQYAKDYNEIKIIGAANSPTRTSEQTQIAQFWLASPTAVWNPAMRQVVAARNPDLSVTARTFALVYLAVADASIACWDAKYIYNYWRPQPAIRSGDFDGNDLTAGDVSWQPLHPTPRHPEYTSGHTTNSSAMATILELLFGDDPGVPLVVTLSGITRQWETFDEGIEEVIDARVYSGIHFRTADEVGARLGRQVARFVSTHALQPCPKGGSGCPKPGRRGGVNEKGTDKTSRPSNYRPQEKGSLKI